jgi:hypothetical protein
MSNFDVNEKTLRRLSVSDLEAVTYTLVDSIKYDFSGYMDASSIEDYILSWMEHQLSLKRSVSRIDLDSTSDVR